MSPEGNILMKKKLILIRHAHRDISDRGADNGLSEKGRAQARALAEHFLAQYDGKKAGSFRMLSSPRRRCVETIQDIADEAHVKIELSRLLVEQEDGESARDLETRVKEFLAWWRNEAPKFTLICSHGDWLPLALSFLIGGAVDFKKGAWAEVTLDEGSDEPKPQLKSLFQPT